MIMERRQYPYARGYKTSVDQNKCPGCSSGLNARPNSPALRARMHFGPWRNRHDTPEGDGSRLRPFGQFGRPFKGPDEQPGERMQWALTAKTASDPASSAPTQATEGANLPFFRDFALKDPSNIIRCEFDRTTGLLSANLSAEVFNRPQRILGPLRVKLARSRGCPSIPATTIRPSPNTAPGVSGL